MPRSRNRTTNRGSWKSEAMTDAMEAVQNGVGVREASRRFDVPYSSLRDRIKAGENFPPPLGRKTTFSDEQQRAIASHCLNLANLFFGLTTLELRRIAFEYAELNNIKNTFNKTMRLAEIFAASDLLTQQRTEATTENSINLDINQNLISRNNEKQVILTNPCIQADNEQPSTSKIQNIANVPVNLISPIPQPSGSSHTKKGKKRQHSIILTSTPLKSVYEEAHTKKQTMTEKKRNILSMKGKDKGKKELKIVGRRKHIQAENSSSEDEIDEQQICNDDSDDDMEAPGYYIPPERDTKDDDECLVCGEFGRNNEIWYRCTICSKWTHQQCSGVDKPVGYICDFWTHQQCSGVDKPVGYICDFCK
ncbi:CENP-B N-terminal DNA-binding domain [Popillia japonica]|uniref:CENP-B N-terminal DNA-binding domain n=1 Tax=Popillia japonica TaxID=7064 RepID=A0AAW1HWI0_POPJA